MFTAFFCWRCGFKHRTSPLAYGDIKLDPHCETTYFSVSHTVPNTIDRLVKKRDKWRGTHEWRSSTGQKINHTMAHEGKHCRVRSTSTLGRKTKTSPVPRSFWNTHKINHTKPRIKTEKWWYQTNLDSRVCYILEGPEWKVKSFDAPPTAPTSSDCCCTLRQTRTRENEWTPKSIQPTWIIFKWLESILSKPKMKNYQEVIIIRRSINVPVNNVWGASNLRRSSSGRWEVGIVETWHRIFRQKTFTFNSTV